jgi:hypothetical protein
MNKKLLAVAVASALAVPVTASAQVAISGIFKVGISSISTGGTETPNRANSSQLRVDDNSSRILFNVTEDLGGGLAAIGQLDLRFAPDQASAAPTSNPIGSGNTYVGLRSTSWGTISLGRWDLHYGNQPDDLASKAGALMGSSVSLMDFQLNGTGTAQTAAVANATRTANSSSGIRRTGAALRSRRRIRPARWLLRPKVTWRSRPQGRSPMAARA